MVWSWEVLKHISSTPSPDIKLKIEKTQGQGDEWLGVVMSQLNPRIGQLGADLLNSRVEPVVQVISERHLTYFLLEVWAPMQFWLLIDVPPNQNYPTHDFQYLQKGALAALSLGRRAFKFTRISMGSARPRMENIRYFLFDKNHIFRKNCKTSNRKNWALCQEMVLLK